MSIQPLVDERIMRLLTAVRASPATRHKTEARTRRTSVVTDTTRMSYCNVRNATMTGKRHTTFGRVAGHRRYVPEAM